MIDYYETLNLKKGATHKEIKKSYRKLALQYHPDKNSSKEAEDKFKKIAEAYGVLSDPQKKSTYDQFGKSGLEGGVGINPQDIFNSFFGGSVNPFGNMAFGGMPFSGMNSFVQSNSIKRKGPSTKINTKITFAEMFNGCKKKFKLNRKVKCLECNAKGIKPHYALETCIKCNGLGTITQKIMIAPGLYSHRVSGCLNCKGEGKIIPDEAKCELCYGNKFIKHIEHIELNIRKGIKDNEIILLENKGDESENWLNPGDIEVCINVIPSENKNIRRVNNDLHIIKKILLREALTGFEIKIQHLDGKKILLSYEHIIKPNQLYKCPNLGFENNGQVGDLIIDFNIIFPDELDDKRKEIINKILPKRKNTTSNTGFKQYTLIPIERVCLSKEEAYTHTPENFDCAQQ